jgi:hypothetical protein
MPSAPPLQDCPPLSLQATRSAGTGMTARHPQSLTSRAVQTQQDVSAAYNVQPPQVVVAESTYYVYDT